MLRTLRDWFGLTDRHHHGHGHHHAQGHDRAHAQGHTHGLVDPTIATSDRGIFAVKWSFVILAITAALQIAMVAVSGSVALLADTIHNVGDATTAIPLWVAFVLARRKPTRTFTYGYGRVEDLAGILIVIIILISALVAGYEAIDRFIRPQPIQFIGWVAVAGIIGFVGNELVAVFRIRIGREIDSAALVADGYHARTDGLTSLAVVVGAFGVWIGYPLADPIIGLLITIVIFGIVWQSARAVLTRMLDGVEPRTIDQIQHAADHVPGLEVHAIKARWLGHRLHADIVVGVDPAMTVADGTALSTILQETLRDHLPQLGSAAITVSAARGVGK